MKFVQKLWELCHRHEEDDTVPSQPSSDLEQLLRTPFFDMTAREHGESVNTTKQTGRPAAAVQTPRNKKAKTDEPEKSFSVSQWPVDDFVDSRWSMENELQIDGKC